MHFLTKLLSASALGRSAKTKALLIPCKLIFRLSRADSWSAASFKRLAIRFRQRSEQKSIRGGCV
jgi:hypothetical protein